MKIINTREWQYFVIDELFEKIEITTKKAFNKATDVSLEQNDEFDLPLVNAKDGNNGIMYYGRETDFESAEMCLDIVCDGAVSTGNVYAQPGKIGVLYNAYLIRLKQNHGISESILLYLESVHTN